MARGNAIALTARSASGNRSDVDVSSLQILCLLRSLSGVGSSESERFRRDFESGVAVMVDFTWVVSEWDDGVRYVE